MYTIEKNVPLPTKGRGVENKATVLRNFLQKMEVGDSFLIPKEEYHVFGNAKKFLRNSKIFTARRVNEKEFRVFRLKDKD